MDIQIIQQVCDSKIRSKMKGEIKKPADEPAF